MDKAFSTISRLLAGHMLGHAFTLLKSWVADLSGRPGFRTFSDRLQSLEKNYQYVIEYFMSAEDDPHREEVTESLIREAFLLLDEVYLEKRLKDSTSYEFRQMLKFQAEPIGPRVESEDDVDGPPQVFKFFWLTKKLEDFDLDMLDEYIHNPQMEEEAQLGLSGLTLNLLRNFSQEGLQFLLTICAGKHEMTIMERAWTGLLLVLMHYDMRLRYFPDITDAFQDIVATDAGSAFAQHALSALIRTSGVEWASVSYNQLQGELTKFVNEYLPKKKDNKILSLSLEDLDDFSKELSDELNSLMDERRNAMIRLREHHLDANFALNRNFYTTSFFSEPFRWWLPYDTDYLRNERDYKIAGQLEPYFSDDLCDSDRFAMITAISDIDNLGEGVPESLAPNLKNDGDEYLVCNSYMQQAYRFFVLNPWGIGNVFVEVPQLPGTTLMKLLRPSAQERIHAADQFLACHAYQSALQLYLSCIGLQESDEVWRNYGLCLQKTGSLNEAVAAYDMSLEINVSEWALRQKVWCLMHQAPARYDEAMQALDTLLELRPEDTGYLFEKGKCLEHMELYLEALDIYCKLDILHPGNMQVMRAIAWCSFISGDMEQAEIYYHKLMDSVNRQMIDFLNCGHFLFVRGERAEAFRHYRHALKLSDSLKSFLQVFRPDRKMLVEKGIPTTDIYLMEDQLISTKE